VSSILKALKKLETGSTQQDKGRLLAGKTAVSDRKWRVLFISLVLFFSLIPGFFLINRFTGGLNSNPGIDADKPDIAAAVPAVGSGQVEKKLTETVPRKQTHPVQAGPNPEKPGGMYALNRTVQATAVQASGPLPPAKSDSEIMQSMPDDSGRPATRDKEKPVTMTAMKPPVRQTDEIGTTSGIRIIDPSILKLQAISWSPEAGDRMAVINNHILREKGSIQGYLIILIDRDSVIVKKGSEKKKLVF